MSYRDEEILQMKQMKKEVEEAEEKDNLAKENEEVITDGSVHVFGEEVKFRKQVIEELGIEIWMPESAVPLTEEQKQVLYPLGNRPSHIFASPEVNFTVGMNHTQNLVPNVHIKDFIPMAQKILEKMGPKTRMVGSHYYPDEKYNMGMLRFYSQAVDCVVENMMGFISLDERLFFVTVSFSRKYEKRYEKIGEQIIKSMKVIEEE